MKQGDKVWFTDWRGVRHAAVIANDSYINGKPVFDIAIDSELHPILRIRRGYSWQVKPRN